MCSKFRTMYGRRVAYKLQLVYVLLAWLFRVHQAPQQFLPSPPQDYYSKDSGHSQSLLLSYCTRSNLMKSTTRTSVQPPTVLYAARLSQQSSQTQSKAPDARVAQTRRPKKKPEHDSIPRTSKSRQQLDEPPGSQSLAQTQSRRNACLPVPTPHAQGVKSSL